MQIHSGIVQKGKRRGEALGFRTANIPLDDTSVSGVYVARAKVGDEEYEGVAFADQVRHVLEIHLFDFGGDIYGWNIHVELLKKIRERKKFSDDVKLKVAIAGDITKAQAYFQKEE